MNIASYIDHTLLKPDATQEQIEQLCNEAVQFDFKGVCIPPSYLPVAVRYLNNSKVLPVTVIGFPLGYATSSTKLFEIEEALKAGAEELDIVHNICDVKNNNWQKAEEEIKKATALIHSAGKKIKVIVESGLLSAAELRTCCERYGAADIDYMKTSTGFSGTGATIEAVSTMRKYLPQNVNIKASGGIRNFVFAKQLIEAGANRLGCSASIEIVKGSKEL